MLSFFRITAILEGISYLALFAITMPLKYMADLPMPNKYVGYAHGVLFIAYIILAIVLWMEKKWSIKKGIILLLASLLPFATFYVENKYLKPEAE
ncbi:integral membrane protein [Flavobacteriaceae bacterium MAR_2009_75]|nr:integral membrane protein [Flavobacteriaceae bacterium MAR_2009_75]